MDIRSAVCRPSIFRSAGRLFNDDCANADVSRLYGSQGERTGIYVVLCGVRRDRNDLTPMTDCKLDAMNRCVWCGWKAKDSSWRRRCPSKEANVQRPAGGPGTELARLLKWLRLTPGNCQCAMRAADMDRLGARWCAENVPTILGWLQSEAHSRKLRFWRFGAAVLVHAAIAIARAKSLLSRS